MNSESAILGMSTKKDVGFFLALPAVLVLGIAVCCTAVENDNHQPPDATAGTPAAAGHTIDAYVLSKPDRVVELNKRLKEVSGLTDISDHELGLVQDEDGIIFFYDLQQQKITREIRFGPPGDFEGLSRVGDKLFVLRSDGVMFEVTTTPGEHATRTHFLGIPTKNNEGLGFDATRNRLLIAPKSRLGKGRAYKDRRAIFAFDLKTETLLPDPVLELSVRAVRAFAEDHDRPLPLKHKKKGKKRTRVALRIMPSSIAVHPVTQEIFVLSSIDRVLAVFDSQGTVTGYSLLDPELFRQPEGITFFSTGDMVISNEGAGERATLLLFSWKGKQQ